MKLTFAALFALLESLHAAPLHRAHHRSAVPPLPAAYTVWHADPNDLKDVLSGKKSLLHTGSRRHKRSKAISDDDFDDLDMSRMFKVREPKQTFTMDESSTILYSMLGQLANPKYLEFAAKTAEEHHLADAKQAVVVQALRLGLTGFQKGGHDFMLDAAASNYPQLTKDQQRAKLIDMLQTMLKHATTAKPPAAPKRARGSRSHARKAAASPTKDVPAAPAKVAEQAAPAKTVAVTKASLLQQDPCAGCDTALAQAYQTCASKHGNPCAETVGGLVTSGPGTKKDIGCCMKKEKHDRCLECSSMDCAHKTCNVNKKYYSTYTIVDKLDDKKAMKKSGWGL